MPTEEEAQSNRPNVGASSLNVALLWPWVLACLRGCSRRLSLIPVTEDCGNSESRCKGKPETYSCWVASGSKDLLQAGLMSLQSKVGVARPKQRPNYRGSGFQNWDGSKGDALGRAARCLSRRLRPRIRPKMSYQTQSSGQSWMRTKWDLD